MRTRNSFGLRISRSPRFMQCTVRAGFFAGIFAPGLLFGAILAPLQVARADTVYFQDGNRIQNVRVLFQGGLVNLIFEDGAIQIHREDQIQSIQNLSVTWGFEEDPLEFERQARTRIAAMQGELRARERERLEREAAERRAGLYFSLAFPGLGQAYRGSYAKAAVFVAGAGFCAVQLGMALENRTRAMTAYDDPIYPMWFALSSTVFGFLPAYSVQSVYFQARIDAVEDTTQRANAAGIGLVALWVASAIDAYFFSDVAPALAAPGATDLRGSGLPEFELQAEGARIVWRFAL